MKKIIILFFVMVMSVAAQHVSHYYNYNDWLSAPASTFQNGLLGYVNPTSSAFLENPQARFYWQDGLPDDQERNWGVFAAAPGLAFGMYRQNAGDFKVTNYSLSSGSQFGAFTVGAGYHWANGDVSEFDYQRTLNVAITWRPNRFVSAGVNEFYGLKDSESETALELGVRPLGNQTLTLFGDILVDNKEEWQDEWWSAGAALNVGPGVSFVGRYFGDERFTAGFVFDLGNASYARQEHYSANSEHAYSTNQIRIGGMRESFVQTKLAKDKAYVPFQMKGSVAYQRYLFFDTSTLVFSELLNDLKAAADDPRIKLIALNFTSLSIASEHAWELREMLKYAQEQDKTVIAFMENPTMTQYHLASVADYLVMDPMGTMMLPGYMMNPTYMSGTLKKLGLGFDEWRFFKYKSANERLSRESMSEADKEQRQAFLDDVYETTRNDIADSRHVAADTVDNWIDNQVVFLAEHAVKAGLVDTLARWSDHEAIINKLIDKKLLKIDRSLLWANTLEKNNWGPQQRVAIVYGIGGTSMDGGMNARALRKIFLSLKNDKQVKAVVFRVDSPGGDAMAADLVAEALHQCAKEKPVVVSQGSVAASGGYWVSMYGDAIFAAPATVTGSIGVIGGWIWDESLSEKLGMTYDLVKRGEHADLTAGVSIPLLGRIPARKLTDEEHVVVEKLIKEMYQTFVDKVAEGRDLTSEQVNEIGQGRIWSGLDGKENKLIDEVGGLAAATEYAKELADLQDAEVQTVEYKIRPGLFNLFGAQVKTQFVNDPLQEYLRLFGSGTLQPAAVVPTSCNPAFLNE